MNTDQDAAVTEEILDETSEPVAEEQADIAATAENETESPEDQGTPSAGDPEQEDQESDSEEATTEPSEEASEAPEDKDDDKHSAKARTKRRFDALLTKTKAQEAELSKAKELLAKLQQPAQTEAPKPVDLTPELQKAAAEYNRAIEEGVSTQEQMRLYQRYQDLRDRNLIEQAEQKVMKTFQAQQAQQVQQRVQSRLMTKLADIHARHPFIVENSNGLPFDQNAPIMRKAIEIAKSDGVPINDYGTLALYLDYADRELGTPQANRTKKVEQRVKEMAERTGIEPGHRQPAPKVSTQAKRLKELERRAEQGDTEAMEAILAHSVTKYL